VWTLLDRYISKTFIGYFILALVVFLSLFVVVDFMSNTSRFAVPIGIIGDYYLAHIWEILHQILPIATLVGVVFTLSTLNKNRELTALFTMGNSLARILWPIMLPVLFIFSASFYVGNEVLPSAKKKRDYIYYVKIKKKPGLFSTVKTDKIWYRSDNIIFNIKTIKSKSRQAFGVTLYYFSPNWKLAQLINAKRAEFGKRGWTLYDGQVTLMSENFSTPIIKRFEKKKIGMEKGLSEIQTTSNASDFLSLQELSRYIKKNENAGIDMSSFLVDYNKKLAFPFSILVMALLGVPFCICSGVAMGKHGYVGPRLAVWGPNFLVALLTLYLFRSRANVR